MHPFQKSGHIISNILNGVLKNTYLWLKQLDLLKDYNGFHDFLNLNLNILSRNRKCGTMVL
ncbi:hypothetical protein CR513_08695, partial [Mucuna pruriens]